MGFRLEEVDADHIAGIHEESYANLRQVADHCAAMRAAGMTGSKDAKVAASVPAILIHKYCNDNGITFADFMREPVHAERFLNDPALAAFRVWEGKV